MNRVSKTLISEATFFNTQTKKKIMEITSSRDLFQLDKNITKTSHNKHKQFVNYN